MHVVYAHDRYPSTRLRSFIDSWWSASTGAAPLASTVSKAVEHGSTLPMAP